MHGNWKKTKKKKESGGVMSRRFNELDMAINLYEVLTFEC